MIKKLVLATFIFLNVYVAQAQTNTPPTLSNFRIENNNKNRIYFDSSEPITASTSSGFTISGKTISSISVNSGQLTGHYFTVSSAFTFWDNNTIRYEGGSNIIDSDSNELFEFALQYISNNIIEPSATTQTLFVAATASGGGSGTISSPYTLQEAINASASGTTIWVKAGQYSRPSNISKIASPTNPIKIIGYKDDINDLDGVNYYSYIRTTPLNSTDAPLILGTSNWDLEDGLVLVGASNIIIRNIQVKHYHACFYASNSTNIIFDNCRAEEAGNYGIYHSNTTRGRTINSMVINSESQGITQTGNYGLVDNCKLYADNTISDKMGYYYSINANNTIIRNVLSYKVDDMPDPGHAMSIQTAATVSDKADPRRCEYNLIENFTTINNVKAVELRHGGVRHNVIRNLHSYGTGTASNAAGGIIFRDNTSFNIVENSFIDISGSEDCIRFEESTEIGSGLGHDNLVRNSIFKGGNNGIVFSSDHGGTHNGYNNKIYNNTLYNGGSLFVYYSDGGTPTNTNCEFKNNILDSYNVIGTTTGWNLDNNNFYNGPSAQGTNSYNLEPRFENASQGNFKLDKLSELRNKGIELEEVSTDFYGNTRPKGTGIDIGATQYQDSSISSVNANAGQDVIICFGENTTLTASGGTSYEWSTGESTASITVDPVETTTYSVTVSDGTDSDNDEVIVTVNEAPTVNAGSDVSLCSGETVTLTATGIGDFLWSNGETTPSITVSPTETATYSVTASNSCSIEVADDVIVTITSGINLTINDDIEICKGETNIILTADSNGDYLWNTGETTPTITVNPMSTTTYTLTSTLGECSKTDEVIVTVNEAPTVNAGPDVSLCSGEAVTLTATGIGNFLWSNGETTPSITVSPTETTSYSVIASNSCSIEVTDDVIVTVTPGINLTINDDIEVCPGETDIILIADSNGDYLWSTGETTPTITVNPTSTTIYTITSTLGDCSITDEVVVTVNEAPTVNAGSDVSLCSGEAVTLTATGIGNFLWSNGETTRSIAVSPTETTTYSVAASNSCSDPVSDEVIVNVTPAITLDAGIDVTLCSGESTTLTATSNGNILWSTGETSVSIVVNPSTTTIYSVTSSSGECSLTDEVIVTINNLPSVSLGEDTKICIGESVTLTAVGTGNFLWSTGETTSSITVNPTVSTTYSVTASTSCSEPVSDAIIVTVNNLPVIDASSDVTIANGSSTVLTATGEGNFLWSTGETSSSVTVNPTSTTTYTVTLTSLEGCSSQDIIIVTVSDNPVTTVNIDAVPDQNICLNESVTLIATGGTNYLWSTGETTASITVSPTETTIFAVTISNGNTVQVDDITIFVDETCSGIANRSINKESKLYPNPTLGQLNIELAGFNDESIISVFDLNGRLVYSENIDNYSPIKILKRKINLSRFGKGIYFVRLINNNTSETKKVLVI